MKLKRKVISNNNVSAVGLKNRIQEELYEETKSLSGQQLIDFYRQKATLGPFKRSKKVA